MPVTDFSIELFVDDSYNPPVYWVESSAQFSNPDVIYVHNGNGTVPTSADADGVFHLDVLVTPAVSPASPASQISHDVDLGALPFTSTDDTLTLHLKDHNGGVLQTGTVRNEDAQHESRPGGF